MLDICKGSHKFINIQGFINTDKIAKNNDSNL